MHQMLLYLQECADRVMSKKIAEAVFECSFFFIQKGLTVRRQCGIKKSFFFRCFGDCQEIVRTYS